MLQEALQACNCSFHTLSTKHLNPGTQCAPASALTSQGSSLQSLNVYISRCVRQLYLCAECDICRGAAREEHGLQSRAITRGEEPANNARQVWCEQRYRPCRCLVKLLQLLWQVRQSRPQHKDTFACTLYRQIPPAASIKASFRVLCCKRVRSLQTRKIVDSRVSTDLKGPIH